MPDLLVVAAGSLFEFAVSQISFPAGRIQRAVFPEGLVINPENQTYLTNNINTGLAVSFLIEFIFDLEILASIFPFGIRDKYR